MQAVILAGGKGTRLQPYTTVLPKPLMPVGDYPILEIILRQLKTAGCTEVILAVGHLNHLFKAFFQDGVRFGVKIVYSLEERELGTAGPLSLLADQLDNDFLVMNGDILTTLDFKKLFDFHVSRKSSATIGTYRREVKIDFGVIESDSDGRVERYIEKPSFDYTVSMGVNVFSRDAVTPYLAPGERLDIPDLMMKMHKDNLRVLCHSEPCRWLDIGRIDDYQEAAKIFESNMGDFLPDLA